MDLTAGAVASAVSGSASPPAAPRRLLRIVTRMNIGGPSFHVAILSTRLDPQQVRTRLVIGTPEPGEGELIGLLGSAESQAIRLRSLQRAVRPWRDLLALAQLIRICWRERPDIIHTHMAKAGTLGRLAGIIYNGVGPGRSPGARAKLMHTFHGHVLEGYFSKRRERLFLAIERWLARRTDRLIAVSESVRRQLFGMGIGRADQWRVIPLGLDLDALLQLPPPEPVDGRLRCGLIGRLVPIKNPGMFIDALAAASEADAVIVGDGPLRAALDAQATSRKLGPRLAFAGWQRELPAVYRDLEVLCLTSWNEGTPVAVIEAMAAGRAVIATDVGGVRDLLADDGEPVRFAEDGVAAVARGMLIRAGDVPALTAALRRLGAAAEVRLKLGAAARRFVAERFNAHRLVQDMHALYAEDIARGDT